MGERPEKEIAMKLDLDKWFYNHMDRISETSSKISQEGEVTNFKMEVWILEAVLWEYIRRAKNPRYFEKVAGWNSLEEDRKNLENKLTQRHLGDERAASQKARLDIEETLIKMKGLMGFAVQQGIAPGYKPPEKKIGLNIQKNSKRVG